MADNLKLATKNLSKFTGTNDFEDWYRDFLATADAWGLDDPTRYKALLLVLDQSILTRVMAEAKEADTLPKEVKDRTLAWLVGELRLRYAYDKTVLRRLQEFLDREKSADETLEGYIVTKRQLYLNFVELFRADKQSWTDGSRVFWEAAIQGLPGSIQPTIKTLHPADAAERKFDQLLKTLRSLQGSEPKLSAPGAPSAPPSPSSAAAPQSTNLSPEKQPGPCPRCGKPGHHRWNCPQRPSRDSPDKDRSNPSQGQGGRKEVSSISSAATEADRRYVSVGVQSGGAPLQVDALVDTGADITVIRYETACLLDPEERWPKPHNLKVLGANGQQLRVVGEIRHANLILGNDKVTTNLVISADVSKSLILGTDVLKKLNAVIDVPSGTLKLPNSNLQMFDKHLRFKERFPRTPSTGGTPGKTASAASKPPKADGKHRGSGALSF